MTEFQVVVKGRVCTVYRNCVKALADAQSFVADGNPAAVQMAVVQGSYRSLTTLWPQVGPTRSNRRYTLSRCRA
jgi:hypothetical protein